MSKEIVKEDDISKFEVISAKEDQERYKLKSTFDNRKLQCKTRENSNFLKNGKTVISVKIQNFSRSRMTKRISPLESSREI